MKKIWLIVGLIVLLAGGVAISEMMKIEQYVIEVNPYTEVTQELRNVQAIEIYNNGKTIRVAFNDVTTADGQAYWVIPSSAVGYERTGLLMQYLTLRLKGDSASDTAIVRVNIWKE